MGFNSGFKGLTSEKENKNNCGYNSTGKYEDSDDKRNVIQN